MVGESLAELAEELDRLVVLDTVDVTDAFLDGFKVVFVTEVLRRNRGEVDKPEDESDN